MSVFLDELNISSLRKKRGRDKLAIPTTQPSIEQQDLNVAPRVLNSALAALKVEPVDTSPQESRTSSKSFPSLLLGRIRNEESLGVARIIVETCGDEAQIESLLPKYRTYLSNIVRAIRESTYYREGNLDSFFQESWRIFRFYFEHTYGWNNRHFISESLHTNKWDCDNSAFLMFDIARTLGFRPQIVWVTTHALLKVENFYFETTSGEVVTQANIDSRYGQQRVETDSIAAACVICFEAVAIEQGSSASEKRIAFENLQAAATIQTGSVSSYIRFAEKLLRGGEIDKANDILAEVISKGASSWHTYSTYGDLCGTQGKFREAAAAYAQALLQEDCPRMSETVKLAKVLLAQGLLAEAEGALSPLMSLSKCPSDVFYLRGLICESRGELEKAKRYFHRSVWLNNDHAMAMLARGRIANLLSQESDSVNQAFRYETAVESFSGQLERGFYFLTKENFLAAQACFEEVVSFFPKSLLAHYGLIQVKSRSGFREEASWRIISNVLPHLTYESCASISRREFVNQIKEQGKRLEETGQGGYKLGEFYCNGGCYLLALAHLHKDHNTTSSLSPILIKTTLLDLGLLPLGYALRNLTEQNSPYEIARDASCAICEVRYYNEYDTSALVQLSKRHPSSLLTTELLAISQFYRDDPAEAFHYLSNSHREIQGGYIGVIYALTLRKLGRFDEALEELDRVIHLDPQFLWARRCRIEILRCNLNNAQRALHESDAYLEICPDSVQIKSEKLLALVELKKFEELETYAKEYHAAYPENALITSLYGLACAEKRDFQKAELLLDRAHGLNPDDPWILSRKVYLFKDCMGDYKKALIEIEKQLKRSPKNLDALIAKLCCLTDLKEHENVLALGETILDLSKDNTTVQAHMGTACINLGRIQEGLYHLQRSIKLSPTYKWAHQQILNGCRLAGETEKLEEAMDNYIAGCPQETGIKVEKLALLWDTGRCAEAGKAASMWIQIHPEEAVINAILGQTLWSSGSSEDGESYLNRAIEIAPGYTWALLQRAKLLKGASRASDALHDVNRILEINPLDSEAIWIRYEILWSVNRFSELEVLARAAIEANPRDANSYYWRGHALSKLDSPLEALAMFNAAIVLYPEECTFYIDRMLLCRSIQGQEEMARSDLERLSKFYPDHELVQREYAWSLFDQARYAEAVQIFRHLISLNGKNSLDWAMLSHAYDTQGDYAQSFACCDSALSIEPSNKPVLEQAIRLLRYFLKDNFKALEYIERYIGFYPEEFFGRYEQITTLTDLGRLSEVEPLVRALQPLHTDDCVLTACLGNVLREKGELEEALMYFSKALQLSPDYTWALEHRARIYLSDVKWHEHAISDLKRLAELSPDNVWCQEQRKLLS